MDTNKKMGAGFGIMLLKNNQVLLGRRHEDPEKASSLMHGEGTWTMPGGKLHFGEDLKEAALRELSEETSLTAQKDDLRVVSLTNDIVYDAHFVTIGFLCEKFEGEPKIMEPDEIVEWQWFSLDNLPKPIFPPSEKILKNFVEGEIYKY